MPTKVLTKTRYKYVHFQEGLYDNEYICIATKAEVLLGSIKYYAAWRQYVIEFESKCFFNVSSLNDIAHFLKQLTKE